MFLTERKKYKTKSIRLRLKKLICFIFLLLFSKKTRFYWRRQTFRKRSYSWGRTKPFWYRWHWNFREFTWICVINKECGNLKVVNGDEELTRNINQKKKLDVSQIACWCSLCDKSKPKYLFDNHVAIMLWISWARVIFLLIKWIEIALTQYLLGVTVGIVLPRRI